MHILRMGLFAIAGGTGLIFTSPTTSVVFAAIIVAALVLAIVVNAGRNSRVAKANDGRTKRFVLAHPQLGVYLGSHGPIGLWSGLNLNARRDAHTFATVYDTREVIRRYCTGHSNLDARDFTVKRVWTAQRHVALRECARIGLPVLVPAQA